jgi:hypothetical protein
VRLQVRVLDTVGAERRLVHLVGGGQPRVDVPGRPVHFGGDVARGGLRVQDRRSRAQRLLRVGDGGQDLVVDVDESAGGFGRAEGFGDDGGDPLSGEPHRLVEDEGVIRVVVRVVMPRRGETDRR